MTASDEPLLVLRRPGALARVSVVAAHPRLLGLRVGSRYLVLTEALAGGRWSVFGWTEHAAVLDGGRARLEACAEALRRWDRLPMGEREPA